MLLLQGNRKPFWPFDIYIYKLFFIISYVSRGVCEVKQKNITIYTIQYYILRTDYIQTVWDLASDREASDVEGSVSMDK